MLGIATVLLALLIPSPLPALPSWPALILYAVLYALLGVLAFRVRPGVYAGLQNVAPVVVLLSLGPVAVVFVVFSGAILQALGHRIFRKWLDLPSHSLVQAAAAALFQAGASGYSTLLMGWLYVALGGVLPIPAAGAPHFTILVLLLCVRAALYGAPILLDLKLRTRTSEELPLTPILPRLLLVELLSIPIALLMAADYAGERPSLLFIVIPGTILIAALLRLGERPAYSLEHRVRELTTLHSIGQSLASSLALPDLMQRVYDQVNRLMRTPTFYIALVDPDTRLLTFPFVMCEGERVYREPRRMAKGVTEYIIRTGQPLLVCGSKAAVHAQLAALGIEPYGTGTMSFLGIPLIADNEVLGVMAVQSDTDPTAFGKPEMALLSTIASQAAITLRNATLYNRVYEMADKLALLNNVSSVVAASLDLNVVLNTICTIVIEVGYADKTAIFLVEKDGASLRLAHSIGLSDHCIAQYQEIRRNSEDDPMQGMDRIEMVAIPDVRSDPRGPGWQKLAAVEGFTGVLSVPLITSERVIGFLAAFYQQAHQFSQSELDLMTTFANQVAVAVANAWLHDDTQARAHELSRLVEASRIFTSSLDLPSVIEKVFDELEDLLRPQSMAIRLLEPGGALLLLGQRRMETPTSIRPVGALVEALEHGQAAMLPLTAEDEELLGQHQARGLYIIPLVSQDKAFGAILIGTDGVSWYTERERQLAEAMVNQAAIAIRNAQLFGQVDAALEDRVAELSAIEAISRKISGTLDLDSIITDVQKTALEVTQADLSGITLVGDDPEHITLVERFAQNSALPPITQVLRSDEGIVGRVLRTGQIARVGDVSKDPDYYPAGLPGMRSELCVPIIHNGERVGALYLESHRPNAFTVSHERFLVNLAEHAAIAIGNARLFEERQRQIEALIKLRNLSLELLSATTLQQVMRLTVEYTLIITHAKDVHLYLYDSTTDMLTFGASLWLDGRENVEASRPSRGGRTHQVARNGQMQLIPDMSKVMTPRESRDGVGYSAVARVPLKRADQVFGVMVITFRDPHYFSDNEIRILDLVSGQSAIAIENARLFEEVRTGRDRMQTILNSVRDGMVLIDSSGALALANRPAEELLGYPLRRVQGQKMLRLIARARQEMTGIPNVEFWIEQVRDLLNIVQAAPDKITRRSYQVRSEDKTRDIDETTLPVHDDKGNIAGRLLVLRDVSEEKELKRFQDEVTDMLIHDLRSPLTGIVSSLNLITDMIRSEEFEDIEQVIGIALDSSQTQLRMIDSLMDLRKLETGRMPLNLGTVSIVELVEKEIATKVAMASEADVRMINLVPADFPKLCLDPDLISRVLSNLLDNALRHTPGGGEVRVEAALVALDEAEQPMAQITVVDTGRGVPPQLREQIFDKFVQVPKSALRGRRGSGVGLAFCKRTLEVHGGRIWVESGPEGGAAFKFTLPLATGSADDTHDQEHTQGEKAEEA